MRTVSTLLLTVHIRVATIARMFLCVRLFAAVCMLLNMTCGLMTNLLNVDRGTGILANCRDTALQR
jgi:hypothetical protein